MTEQEQKQKNLENNLGIMAYMLNELARMYREGVAPEKAWAEIHKVDDFLADRLAGAIMMLYGEDYLKKRLEQHKEEIVRLSERAKYMHQEGFSPKETRNEIHSMNPEAAETLAMLIDHTKGGVKH